MPRHTLRTFWLCGFLVAASLARADYRVVVQEAHYGRYLPMQITPDGRYAWVVTGVNQHVLQVIDPAGSTVLRRFYLADTIQSASIDSATGKIAVSTQAAIWFGSLADERLQEILPGFHGVVLLQEKAGLLAVLGYVPHPKPRVQAIGFDARSLGVFDLGKREWRFVRETPIVVPSLEERRYDGFGGLLFHDGAVLAAGIGGSVFSMIPITFHADVRLDLTSGKTKITTGPRSRYGRPMEDRKPKVPPAPPGKRPADEKDKDEDFDPKYKTPAPLRAAQEAYTAALKKVAEEKLMTRLHLGESDMRDAKPMPFAVADDGVHMAVRRFLPVAGGSSSHAAVLTLSKDGKYSIGPTRDTGSNPLGRGQPVHIRVDYNGMQLNDLITGKPVVPAAALEVKEKKGERQAIDLFFLEADVLLRDAERLALYKPGQEKPLWSRKPIKETWNEVVLDASGKTLALICGGEPILAEVLRVADGATLGRVPRPGHFTENYMSMGLSLDGKRLAAVRAGGLHVFDVAGGALLAKHDIAGDPYWRGVHAFSGGWIVSGESGSQVFDETAKKWTATIPFQSAIDVRDLAAGKDRRLLLQSYGGQCCVADPVAGKVLDRWVAAESGQYRAPTWNAVFAGGKALLRPTGWNPTLDIVDLRDLKIVATVHHVPVDKSIGVIVFTPDGWWDASPGAERHVAVFHKGRRVDGEKRDGRRNAKVIGERLAALWR